MLGSRKVGPKTYLSILVDMLQKGNLTITGGYGESVNRRLQSRVWFTRQFEPDQPWEKEVYSALTSFSVSDLLKTTLRYAEVRIRGAAEKLLPAIWTSACGPGAFLMNPPCRSWQTGARGGWREPRGFWPQ